MGVIGNFNVLNYFSVNHIFPTNARDFPTYDWLMKFIHNRMRKGQTWLLLLVCVWTVAGLLPLEKEEIDGKYEIGTIQNLYFMKDKILFHADSDLFGFLDPKDGQLISFYELEQNLGERVISVNEHAVTIVRDKKVNVFWPATSEYVRSFESNFLEKHPDFTKIVAILPSNEGAHVLTDKYLMLVPLVAKGNKLDSVTEKILIELTDPTEVFYTLITVYNREEKRLEIYMGSLIQNDKVNQVCFRKIRDGKVQSKKCTDIKPEDEVEDIVASAGVIYIEVTGGVLVLDAKMDLVVRLDSEAQQYYAGLVTIGDDHQFYSPFTKSTHNLRIIEQTETSRKRGPMGILGLAVQENTFEIQNATKDHKFSSILSFPRGPQDDPRKVWSFSQDNHLHFRLYIEFDDGRLSCSSVDTQKKTVEKLWEITTIQSVKVAKEELQAKDIQEEGIDTKQPKAAEPQDVKQSQREDIEQSVPPKQP